MADSQNSLSGTVKLDTEDYKTGVAELSRQVKVIESSFKAVAASTDDWTKSSEGLEARQKSLTSIIEIQKQKITLLSAAYQDVVSKKGANSKAAQDLEVRINRENEALNKNQLELSHVTDGTVKLTSAQKSAGNATRDTSLKFTEFNSALALVKQGLAAANKIYDETIGKTLKYDLAMGKLAQTLGMGVEETSRLIQAGDDFGTEQETLTNVLEFASKNGLQPTIENIAKMSDHLLSIQDPTIRNAEAAKQFGKSWFDASKTILAGGEAIRANAAAQADGMFVTEAQYAAAEKNRLAQDAFNDSLMATKNTLSNAVIPALTEFLNKVNEDIARKGLATAAMESYRKGLISQAELYRIDALAITDLTSAQKIYDDILVSKIIPHAGEYQHAMADTTTAVSEARTELQTLGFVANKYDQQQADKASADRDAIAVGEHLTQVYKDRAAAQELEAQAIQHVLSVASGGIGAVRSAVDTLKEQIKNIQLVPLEEWATKSVANIGAALAEGLMTPAQAAAAAAKITAALDAGVAAFNKGKPINVPTIMDFSKPITGMGSKGQNLADAIINDKPIPDVKAVLDLNATQTPDFVAGLAAYNQMKDKTVTIVENTVRTSGDGGKTWHPRYLGPDGKWHEGYWAAHGLDTVIGPGFPNDSAIVHVSSGERVTVTPANQISAPGGATAGGRGGGTVNNYKITINDAMAMHMFLSQQRRAGLAAAEEKMK